MNFTHESLSQKIRFGSGTARDALSEVTAGAARIMLICSPREAERAAEITVDLPVALHHHDVAMHVPVEVADRGRSAAAEARADLLLCFGGGSAIGLAKAVALTTSIPIVAVPTTYSGSEATSMWGMTDNGVKTTGVDPRVAPRAIVYDAELTLGLPAEIGTASGLNALAHSVDAMWGPRADPIDRVLAAESARAVREGLPAIAADASDLTGREQVLYAAYLAATAFSSAGSGLHHKICHVLGGAFDLPHAQTHAAVLPHVLAFNAPAAPEAQARLAGAFGAPTAVEGLAALYDEVRAPRSLRDLGMAEADIAPAVEAVLPLVPAGNPRPVTAADLHRILSAAWSGATPEHI
ncbi:maleylacetate reductase [Tsukamurella pseudospumae]|uniref:Maleylacetate reductase n=1 Tax=Tsukamurella pseudospumae TaxID=239498 RepID=A0A138A7R9_9ACTN|nr:maleylacetate reductase [Tsukamurella pseudospumae]KXO99180.1 maleylacetate reductase [Tsukamurella pseudospumae]KXP06465.1 maleylacetate reductase [Tsukamurella pseudospumae]